MEGSCAIGSGSWGRGARPSVGSCEVRVAGEQTELVLHDKRRYPEVVRRDRGALPAQLVE